MADHLDPGWQYGVWDRWLDGDFRPTLHIEQRPVPRASLIKAWVWHTITKVAALAKRMKRRWVGNREIADFHAEMAQYHAEKALQRIEDINSRDERGKRFLRDYEMEMATKLQVFQPEVDMRSILKEHIIQRFYDQRDLLDSFCQELRARHDTEVARLHVELRRHEEKAKHHARLSREYRLLWWWYALACVKPRL